MRPVLIDTDPGIDDALALLYAWASPEIVVEAVTTVAGNVPVEVATANLARLLALCPPRPAPQVAAGAGAPLARPLVTAAYYHGEDGLGDTGDWPVPALATHAGHAVELILAAARRHGPRLTIIALGPLTNLALALEADPEALRRIGRLVAMGGAVDVPGNITPAAEFNMHVDPEAAARVLEAGLPIDLVPLDATRQAVLSRARLEAALAARPGPVADRIGAFTRRAFRVDGGRGTPGMTLHDPLAVGVAVEYQPIRAMRTGIGVVDWDLARIEVGPAGETRRAPGRPNCRVAVRAHPARFLATFLARLGPAPLSPERPGG